MCSAWARVRPDKVGAGRCGARPGNMEAAGAGAADPAPRLEAPGSSEDRLFLVKGAVGRGCRGESTRGPGVPGKPCARGSPR